MPSLKHEALVELIRRCPELLVELLGFTEGVGVRATEVSAELNQLVPVEFRADGVWLLDGPMPLVAALEVQLSPDPAKPWVWPLYLCGLRARHRRPAVLLVLTLDPAVARWASRPLVLGPGSVLRPVVVGPEQIPRILDPEQARRCPEQAVLSVLAHGGSADAAGLGLAALAGIETLDEERIKLYSELVWQALHAQARTILEVIVTRNFELKGELLAILERRVTAEAMERSHGQGVQEGLAHGLAHGERLLLRRQLSRRFGLLPPWAEERLDQAAPATLERWADAVLTAETLEAVLDT